MTMQHPPIENAAGKDASGPVVPLRPHPLSNDLTAEPLPPRSPVEDAMEEEGVGAAPRHVSKVIGVIVALFAIVALVAGGAIAFSSHRGLFIVGAAVTLLFLTFISAPILLAAGTKAAQDEAVRDGKTAARRRRWDRWRR